MVFVAGSANLDFEVRAPHIPAQGQTVINRRDFLTYRQPGWKQNQPLTQACMQVDAPQCLQVFYNTLMANWLCLSTRVSPIAFTR